MPRLVFVTVLLAGLAAASPAVAKEVQSVRACGDGDCATSKAASLVREMTDIGPPADAPAAAAPFFRLNLAVGDGKTTVGRFPAWWVPSAGRLLGDEGMWMAVRPEVRRRLDHLTRGLVALPSARLPGFAAGAADDATPPHPAPAVASDGNVPVVALLLGAVMLVVLVGLLVRRHVPSVAHPQERSG